MAIPFKVALTETAASTLGGQIAAQGDHDMMLRIVVVRRRCSGLRYQVTWDCSKSASDIVTDCGGVKVVVGIACASYLTGTTIDIVRATQMAFVIDNPNAPACTCACGDSFH